MEAKAAVAANPAGSNWLDKTDCAAMADVWEKYKKEIAVGLRCADLNGRATASRLRRSGFSEIATSSAKKLKTMENAIDKTYRVVRFLLDKVIGYGAAIAMLSTTLLAISEVIRRYAFRSCCRGQDAVTYGLVAASSCTSR